VICLGAAHGGLDVRGHDVVDVTREVGLLAARSRCGRADRKQGGGREKDPQESERGPRTHVPSMASRHPACLCKTWNIGPPGAL